MQQPECEMRLFADVNSASEYLPDLCNRLGSRDVALRDGDGECLEREGEEMLVAGALDVLYREPSRFDRRRSIARTVDDRHPRAYEPAEPEASLVARMGEDADGLGGQAPELVGVRLAQRVHRGGAPVELAVERDATVAVVASRLGDRSPELDALADTSTSVDCKRVPVAQVAGRLVAEQQDGAREKRVGRTLVAPGESP